jgi:NADPH:quinone reductase-like Zn-dependent oxidoreductase
MKAMVYSRYGGPNVVTLAELPKPAPKDNEVLIRVHATTVSSADWRARSLNMPRGFGLMGRLVFGVFGPRQPVLGTELSGVVEAVGAKVTRWSEGDEVIAFPGGAFGSHAEYRTMSEHGLIAPKPANLTHEEAASLLFGGATALPMLRDKARVKAGDAVLVVGASGAVGSAAVQIAQMLGAKVTGVTSEKNRQLVLSLGAEQVIDYASSDFVQSGQSWDVIIDTTGTAPYPISGTALRPGGRLVVVLGSLSTMLGHGRPPKSSGRRVIAEVASPTIEHIQTLAHLAVTGELKPVIDRVYPLEGAAEAHAYVDTGRKRGSVVLLVAEPGRRKGHYSRSTIMGAELRTGSLTV